MLPCLWKKGWDTRSVLTVSSILPVTVCSVSAPYHRPLRLKCIWSGKNIRSFPSLRKSFWWWCRRICNNTSSLLYHKFASNAFLYRARRTWWSPASPPFSALLMKIYSNEIIDNKKSCKYWYLQDFSSSPSWARTNNPTVNSRVLYHWAIEDYNIYMYLQNCIQETLFILLLPISALVMPSTD